MGEAKRRRDGGYTTIKKQTDDQSIADLEREIEAGNVEGMATIARLKSPPGTMLFKIYTMGLSAKDLAAAIIETAPDIAELIRKESMN